MDEWFEIWMDYPTGNGGATLRVSFTAQADAVDHIAGEASMYPPGAAHLWHIQYADGLRTATEVPL